MMKFRYAFLCIAVVLVVHAVAVMGGWYQKISWFDVPMHYFGGLAIGVLAMATFSWVLQNVRIRASQGSHSALARFLLEAIFVLGFVMLVGVAWEWFEFLCDAFLSLFIREIQPSQLGLADTMDDLLNDVLGAGTVWLSFRNWKEI